MTPYFINLSGGEPLVFDGLFNFAKDIKKCCRKLILTTNGTLVENYPRNYFNIFDHIQISIDGGKKIHEEMRGYGNYEKAISAAKYLAGTSSISFLSTICSANCHQIGELVEIAQRTKTIPKLGRMCGFGHSNLSPITNPSIWRSILAESSKYGILNDDPLNFWFDEKKKSSTRSNKIVGGCTAGIAGVAISPELDVYPCVKLRISAGNLKEQSLKDIWLNSPLFASLRDWNNLKGPCPSCQYVSVCRGCRADAWARTGDYLAPDPLCWLNKNGE